MKYKRILLKLSGEALMGSQQYGIDPSRLSDYANDIKSVVESGVQVAIVIGGGNIFRGMTGAAEGMDRVQGDYMGMMATVINSMALQAAIEKTGTKTALLSSFQIGPVSELMSRRRAVEYLEQGKVVIIAGGTGNPYFTTDTASVLRGVEIEADVFLKGTLVNDMIINSNDYLYVATDYGVLESTNSGQTFEYINEGLFTGDVDNLATDSSGFLYASSYNPCNLARSLEPTITGLPINLSKDHNFVVQTYPNPFNIKTTINWDNSNDLENVDIIVTSTSGEIILNERIRNTGKYEFLANNIKAGIYYYSIIEGINTYSGKMVLVK